jgi:putative tricarboxylic transport membrane protein
MNEPVAQTTAQTNERRRPDRAALVIAAGLLVLAAVVAWDTTRLAAGGAYARVGPQTIPYVIAGCLAGLGIWTIFAALRRDFPEREPQEAKPVLWIVGGLVLQLVLIRWAGFSIATGVLFGLVARGFGERRLWLSLPSGILLAALVWLIFARGLQLSLPAGPPEQALIWLQQTLFPPPGAA